MRIRPENERDISEIRGINVAAFDTAAEAGLVDRLRAEANPFLSLVAEDGDVLTGHIAFSPMRLDSAGGGLVMGLAPMSVVPSRQRQGIGSMLVREGVRQCRDLGAVAVVVLGHAGFYPRFGFAPASRHSVRSTYDVPDELFMVHELKPGSLSGIPCVAQYHQAFDSL